MSKFFNKDEIKYLTYSGLFAFVFFVLILPLVIKSGLDKSSPYIQFLLFNISILIFLQLFLKAVALDRKIRFKIGIGLVLLFISLDVLIPPVSVGLNGNLLGSAENSPLLIMSSSDYVLGYMFTSWGITGFPVFLLTYIVSPLLLLIISAYLLKNFVHEV